MGSEKIKMELLQSKIVGGGGGGRGAGEEELCEARKAGSAQGRTFTGAQSITKASQTNRRGRGRRRERAEKGERPEAGTGPVKSRQLPGRLPRGSNLQIHLSPRILGQTSLV